MCINYEVVSVFFPSWREKTFLVVRSATSPIVHVNILKNKILTANTELICVKSHTANGQRMLVVTTRQFFHCLHTRFYSSLSRFSSAFRRPNHNRVYMCISNPSNTCASEKTTKLVLARV